MRKPIVPWWQRLGRRASLAYCSILLAGTILCLVNVTLLLVTALIGP